ncbi:MAG: hypothetical protein ACFFAU_03025 [Candidatus Hodarchaeota archaeon]
MKDEISYLLKLPTEEILKAVLQEALKDLRITAEEEALLAGLKHDLALKTKQFAKFDKSSPFTKQELQFLLIEQRNVLREIVSNTYNRASADGIISADEMSIYRALLRKVDEITAKKIGMFIDIDLTTKEPHIFTFHPKIGRIFSDLTATIIMDIFSKNVKMNKLHSNEETIQTIVDKFSSEESNKLFIARFKEVLEDLVKCPIESPAELIVEINRIIDKM